MNRSGPRCRRTRSLVWIRCGLLGFRARNWYLGKLLGALGGGALAPGIPASCTMPTPSRTPRPWHRRFRWRLAPFRPQCNLLWKASGLLAWAPVPRCCVSTATHTSLGAAATAHGVCSLLQRPCGRRGRQHCRQHQHSASILVPHMPSALLPSTGGARIPVPRNSACVGDRGATGGWQKGHYVASRAGS